MPILELYMHRMETDRAILVFSEKINLHLQFVWIGKVIVAIAQGCVLAFAGVEQNADIASMAPVWKINRAHMAVRGREIVYDILGAVIGAIIDYNMLNGKTRLLRRYAYHAFKYVILVVVCHGQHGKSRFACGNDASCRGKMRLPVILQGFGKNMLFRIHRLVLKKPDKSLRKP